MTFISIENLTTHYDTSKGKIHALDDVNFSLEKGESVGIAGESACGKSTLGLSLIRMIPNGKIVSGRIIFDGKSFLDISDSEFVKKQRWKVISMIFQGAMNSLDPVFTIKEQFIEILKEHDFKGNLEKIILDSLLSINLQENILQKYPHELSGGMKQRVIIAMALLLKPKFVKADDPVAWKTFLLFLSNCPITSRAITDFPVPGPPFTTTTDFLLLPAIFFACVIIVLYAVICSSIKLKIC